MPNARFFACCTIFFLGCAASSLPVSGPARFYRVDTVMPEDGRPDAVPDQAALPKIDVRAPRGWERTMVEQAVTGTEVGHEFSQSETGATVFFRVLDSEGKSADLMAAYVAWLHGVSGREIFGIERAINGRTLAMAQWRGTRREAAVRGKFGVRGLVTRTDLLLVVNAKWQEGTPQDVLDQIDRMILSATIK